MIQTQSAQHSQIEKPYSYSKKGNWTSFHGPSCTIVFKQVAENNIRRQAENQRESQEPVLERDFTANTHTVEQV